jgi:hypothetical protein
VLIVGQYWQNLLQKKAIHVWLSNDRVRHPNCKDDPLCIEPCDLFSIGKDITINDVNDLDVIIGKNSKMHSGLSYTMINKKNEDLFAKGIKGQDLYNR